MHRPIWYLSPFIAKSCIIRLQIGFQNTTENEPVAICDRLNGVSDAFPPILSFLPDWEMQCCRPGYLSTTEAMYLALSLSKRWLRARAAETTGMLERTIQPEVSRL